MGIGKFLGKDLGAKVQMESWKCIETTGDKTKLLGKDDGAKTKRADLWNVLEVQLRWQSCGRALR